MTRKFALLSTVALGLAPVLAHAGGEVMPPPPPPAPVPVAPVVQAPPPPVVEEDRGGPYVALYGGASWLQDSDERFDSDALGISDKADLEFDTGWVAGGAVGYQADIFGLSPRLELDGAWRENDLDDADFGDFDSDDASGEIRAASGMLNAWFDVPVAGFAPYVGGGVGGAWVDAKDLSFGDGVEVDDDDTVFAWQLGAGIGYQFTENLTATVDYRWFNTEEATFKSGGERLDLDYESHNVLAGLRYTF